MRAIFLLCSLVLVLSSCIKNNPDPVWIEVNEWTLEANSSLQGAEGVLTHNISDAWLYVGGKLIGVFQVPFKVPVLLSGTQEIRIFPTIKNNGISATKKIYPFLEEYDVIADLVQNETYVINPVTRYKSGLTFTVQDFEDQLNIEEASTSTATLLKVNDPTYFNEFINGGASGHYGQILMDQSSSIYKASSNFYVAYNMLLPKGEEVYLEIDYYTTVDFVTGLLAITPSGTTENPMIQLNKQDASPIQWKKIYIDLREVVSGIQDAQYFEFTFNAELDADISSGVVNIDNIKAVHF